MALRALLRKRLTRPSIRRPFYFLLGGRSTAPHSVGIELSHRCNLRCRTCWLYGENGTGAKFVKDELSAKEVKNLIDQIARHHCDFYIGGSEPYIRRDFPEILQYAKEKGLRVAFTTNGVLPDQSQLERLIAIGTDSVNFSIDGGEELHDQLRGPGVFRKVVSSVKELRRRRDKAQSIRPSIFINTVISAGILGRIEHEIGSIIKATEDGADYYRLHHLWYATPRELQAHQQSVRKFLNCGAPGAACHLLSDSAEFSRWNIAKEISSLRFNPRITMFPEMNESEIASYYSEGYSKKQQCFAPFSRALIKPNGEVVFCPDEWIDDYSIGNIRENSFDRIWNSPQAMHFRKIILKQKSFPGCKRCSAMYC